MKYRCTQSEFRFKLQSVILTLTSSFPYGKHIHNRQAEATFNILNPCLCMWNSDIVVGLLCLSADTHNTHNNLGYRPITEAITALGYSQSIWTLELVLVK